jgi:hypothetical protein
LMRVINPNPRLCQVMALMRVRLLVSIAGILGELPA